jgi:hydrogenase nickel incorporation protein HypB
MAINEGRRTVPVFEAVRARNDQTARRNRERFARAGLTVVNLLSSPGSGKTALLERTLRELGERVPIGVIVGDLATDNDARRLQGTGAQVIQIVTGDVCHLEADMVDRAAAQLNLDTLELLFIENVGNLVCPATYDLGEDLRVALLSVTEGEDKPLKYPVLFKNVDTALITKMDLAAAVEFDEPAALANLHAVAPQARIMELSSKSGVGMDAWYDLLEAAMRAIKAG